MKGNVAQPVEARKSFPNRDGPRKWIPRFANLSLWLLLCAMAGTGLLLAYRLPPGSRGGHGLSALGMSRHEWGGLHQWISVAFLVLVLVHMALHWRWFWQIASRKRAWPLFAGMIAGLVLAAGIVLLPVEHAGGGAREGPHSDAAADALWERGQGHGKRYRGESE